MSKREQVRAGHNSDSEKTIADLSQAIKDLESGSKQPGEGILAVARDLASRWKFKKRPLFGGLLENKRLLLLVALVVALRRDHEVLKSIRRHRADELEKLINEALYADAMAAASALASAQPKPKSKQKSKQKFERKRRRWRRNFYSSIEYQFGGGAEAERRKTLSALDGLPYEPTCLDDIFAGETVNMQRLEDLFFGIERHRLGKALQGVQKRRYDYRAVAKIMESLLKRPRKKRKRRGRSPRNPWLDDPNDPDRQLRVLNGIIARINRLSVQEHIANEFLTVIRPHLADSGNKMPA